MNNSLQGNICESCGAAWPDGFTCEEAFHQCLAWEFDEPQTRFVVHHYMVLCYHLQHPHLYSEQGLVEARKLLDVFIEGESPDTIRRENKNLVDQANRDWKVTARLDSIGAYEQTINWNMNIADVLENGPLTYIESVNLWAKSTHETLHKAIHSG